MLVISPQFPLVGSIASSAESPNDHQPALVGFCHLFNGPGFAVRYYQDPPPPPPDELPPPPPDDELGLVDAAAIEADSERSKLSIADVKWP